MNSNLTPERRTDKNGKTSTRWVKSAVSSDKPHKNLPEPKAPAAPPTPHLDKAFERANLDTRNPILDPSVVLRVEEMLESANNGSTTLMIDAGDMVFDALKKIRDGYGDHDFNTDINNVAVFGKKLLEGKNFEGSINRYLRGLHVNGVFEEIHDFLTEATDEQRSQATALIHFANSVSEPWVKMYFGYDADSGDIYGEYSDEDSHYIAIDGDEADAMTQFIMEHHEHVDDIIRIVEERGSADVSLLESLLGHDEQALRAGLL